MQICATDPFLSTTKINVRRELVVAGEVLLALACVSCTGHKRNSAADAPKIGAVVCTFTNLFEGTFQGGYPTRLADYVYQFWSKERRWPRDSQDLRDTLVNRHIAVDLAHYRALEFIPRDSGDLLVRYEDDFKHRVSFVLSAEK